MTNWTVVLAVRVSAKTAVRATTAVRTVTLPFVPTRGLTILLEQRGDAYFRCDDVVYDLRSGVFRAVQFTETDHFDHVLGLYTAEGFVDDAPAEDAAPEARLGTLSANATPKAVKEFVDSFFASLDEPAGAPCAGGEEP